MVVRAENWSKPTAVYRRFSMGFYGSSKKAYNQMGVEHYAESLSKGVHGS